MGLRDDIQQDVAVAFDEDLADVISTFTLRKKTGQGEYDPEEDTHSPIYADYPSRGVAMPASSGQVLAGIALYSDETLMILANEIGAVPEEGDLLLMGDSEYRVLNNSAVAAGNSIPIVYNLIIRRND